MSALRTLETLDRFQPFYFLALSFHRVTFSTQGFRVGFMIVFPSLVQGYDMIYLETRSQHALAVPAHPRLPCGDDSFFVRGESPFGGHQNVLRQSFRIQRIRTAMNSEELTFEKACDLVRERPEMKISDSDKRIMYTYYKVATVGCKPNVPRPSSLSPKAVYWDAWNTHGAKLTPEIAKMLYIQMVAARASE